MKPRRWLWLLAGSAAVTVAAVVVVTRERWNEAGLRGLTPPAQGAWFEDVSAGSGLDVDGSGMGVAVGDVNNDGRPDVLLTGYPGIRLFLNKGDGTFTEVTREAGLDSVHWATSASFFGTSTS